MRRTLTITVITTDDANPGADLEIKTVFDPPIVAQEASVTALLVRLFYDTLRAFAEAGSEKTGVRS